MKNSWKGFVVGGITGAAVGVVLDIAAKAGQRAVEVKEMAQERAPEALHWAKNVTERATGALREADVGDKVHDLAHRLVEAAPSAEQAREAVNTAGKAVKSAAASAKDAVSTAAASARDAAGPAAASARDLASTAAAKAKDAAASARDAAGPAAASARDAAGPAAASARDLASTAAAKAKDAAASAKEAAASAKQAGAHK